MWVAMHSAYLVAQVEFNNWGNRQILKTAALIAPEQLLAAREALGVAAHQ